MRRWTDHATEAEVDDLITWFDQMLSLFQPKPGRWPDRTWPMHRGALNRSPHCTPRSCRPLSETPRAAPTAATAAPWSTGCSPAGTPCSRYWPLETSTARQDRTHHGAGWSGTARGATYLSTASGE